MSDNEEKVWNDKLEEYVKECKIFVDTSSIMYEESGAFWVRLLDSLIKNKRLIIVTQSVAREIEKHANSQTADDKRVKLAQKRIEFLQTLYDNDLLYVLQTDGAQSHADNEIQAVLTNYRIRYKILLITQDNNLAKDVLKLNENESTRANEIVVKRISPDGRLTGYGWQREGAGFDEANIKPFQASTQLIDLEDAPIPLVVPVQVGSRLITSKGLSVELGDSIAAGGEGVIYKTNTEYVAKIYKPEHLTQRRFKKIRLMLSRPIKFNGICWPVADLYNAQRRFVGFLMPAAKGKEIQRSIFLPVIFKQRFPNWNKCDTVELCLTILEKIIFLHRYNIIIGDINPGNILVVSPKEVYFVDTDSYQIEGFPCPVGTTNFTAPEIQSKNFGTFLRTIGNENFAIATLLFMIMLPGKPPYAQQGGEDPATNIINMDFSYPFGEETNKRTPDGPWRFMWSHLTYRLKESFYNTFRKDKRYSDESTRLSDKDWYNLFKEYHRLLNNGRLIEQDPMSADIFPTRFKRDPNSKYVKCMFCDELILEESGRKVCRKCGDKELETYTCSECGKEMVFNCHEKYNMKLARGYSYCRECKDKVVRSAFCVTCGEKYELTGGEVDRYLIHGGEIPRSCPKCLRRKRELVQCVVCQRDVERRYVTEFERTNRCVCRECLNQVGHSAYCTECGDPFTLTNGEVEFYKSKGFDLPKRCKKCRNGISRQTPKVEPATSFTKSLWDRFFG